MLDGEGMNLKPKKGTSGPLLWHEFSLMESIERLRAAMAAGSGRLRAVPAFILPRCGMDWQDGRADGEGMVFKQGWGLGAPILAGFHPGRSRKWKNSPVDLFS